MAYGRSDLQSIDIQSLKSSLGSAELELASDQMQRAVLASGIDPLDRVLGGGLPLGSVSEWGLPFGLRGREIILSWVARVSQQGEWILWVLSKAQIDVYPPAWRARGISLERIRFVHSERPVQELKQAFIDPLFKLIIVDDPKKLTSDDCAFMARWARRHCQLTFLLRDRLLSTKNGNIWAKVRVNAWFHGEADQFVMQAIRGGYQGKSTEWRLSSSDFFRRA
jgi:RecA/RadA recombinase